MYTQVEWLHVGYRLNDNKLCQDYPIFTCPSCRGYRDMLQEPPKWHRADCQLVKSRKQFHYVQSYLNQLTGKAAVTSPTHDTSNTNGNKQTNKLTN